MRIVDLADQPWHIPRLSRWHHREWTHLYPHEEVADFARELDACLGDQLVPSTFIAIDGALLGSASLLAADMLTHPELTPWVASVYVRRAARASGVVRTLYLFTPESVEFYRRLDWVVLSRELYQGVPVTLMQVDLGTSD